MSEFISLDETIPFFSLCCSSNFERINYRISPSLRISIYSSLATGMYLQTTAKRLPVKAIHTTLTALGTRAAYCPK